MVRIGYNIEREFSGVKWAERIKNISNVLHDIKNYNAIAN